MTNPAKTTEIHHQKDGVLVSWGHSCGHLSNPMWYYSAAKAEDSRAEMEQKKCWACRPLTPLRTSVQWP